MEPRDDTEKKFQEMKVEELKNELRKRKAVLRGKKKDLLERLLYYHRNADFTTVTPTSIQDLMNGVTDAPMWTPDTANYKDINAGSPLPHLTLAHIDLWCSRFFISSRKGLNIYKARYVLTARFAPEGTSTFIKGECKPEMKKSGQYTVDIQLSSTGGVQGAHCECSAGSGDQAHCKHVVALLAAVEDMVRNKKIVLRVACTQELQTFHQPSQPYFGTPLKCDKLPGQNFRRLQNCTFQAVDDTLLKPSLIQNRVRNLVINFCATHPSSRIPLKFLYMPANPYAIGLDHDYLLLTPQQQILQHFKLISITDQEIEEVEEATRGQADNEYWKEIRKVHLSASKFGQICRTKSDEAKKNLANSIILCAHSAAGPYVDHGKMNEKKALKCYEDVIGVKTRVPGTFISRKYPFLSGSPDGLVVTDNDKVVEIKCPYTARDQQINHFTVPYLVDDCNGNLSLAKEHDYYFQVQGQMLVTGRSNADFAVWTFKDFKVLHVLRDVQFIHDMQCKLEEFWEKFFKPALLEKYFYKYYSECFSK